MHSRYGRRDEHDDDPYGRRDDRGNDRARAFGARDGEGGSWAERRYAERAVFDAEHDDRGFEPNGDRTQRERSGAFGPRYERDEGFESDRDVTRFARDDGRRDHAASMARPESFVDLYRRAEGQWLGDARPRWNAPADDPRFPNRSYAHHLAGVPSYEASRGLQGWNRWRDDASRPEAAAHPSPYTDHVGPLARGHARPSVEEGRGWSGQRTTHTGELGGAWTNPAWEVPFRRDASTSWGERPHIGKGPRGYVRSDERIREEVCDCLSDGYVDASRVEVDVEGGVVTLSGQVPDKASKRRIEDITEACRGVKAVENQIRVQRVTQGDAASTVGSGASDAVSTAASGGARTSSKSVS